MGIIEQFLKVIENLTLRKAIALIFTIALLLGGAFIYERFTANFRLAKLHKATEVLQELQKIGDPKALPEDLKLTYDEIARELKETVIEIDSISSGNSQPSGDANKGKGASWLWKLLTGSAIWLFLGIFVVVGGKKDKSTLQAFLGILVIGCFFGLINLLIPNFGPKWVNLVVMPLITFGLIAGVPMSISAVSTFQKVRTQSKRIAVTNNLRQIASAGQQYILEKGVKAVHYDELIPEYFMPIKSVDGESYDSLVVIEDGGSLSVTTRDGLVVEYPY